MQSKHNARLKPGTSRSRNTATDVPTDIGAAPIRRIGRRLPPRVWQRQRGILTT
jgi:hypothetical protein